MYWLKVLLTCVIGFFPSALLFGVGVDMVHSGHSILGALFLLLGFCVLMCTHIEIEGNHDKTTNS